MKNIILLTTLTATILIFVGVYFLFTKNKESDFTELISMMEQNKGVYNKCTEVVLGTSKKDVDNLFSNYKFSSNSVDGQLIYKFGLEWFGDDYSTINYNSLGLFSSQLFFKEGILIKKLCSYANTKPTTQP